MNEYYIQTMLMRRAMWHKNHQVIIPNSRDLLYWEADLLSVTQAGLVHEFEIKISRADYNRDFKKENKHQRLRLSVGTIPNYFWFVTWDFDIEPPDYAGWLKILPEGNWDKKPAFRTEKEAPRLHGRTWGDEKIAKIAHLLSYRLIKWRGKEEKRVEQNE